MSFSNRKEYNSSETINHLKKIFIKMYNELDIEKISIQELCNISGISRTLFYRYFDDKYSILESIENKLLEDIRFINRNLNSCNFNSYEKGNIFPIFYETICYIKENEDYFKPLLSKNGDPSFIYKWKKVIRNDISSKFKHDKVEYYDLGVVSEMIASSIIGLYTYWLFERADLSCEDLSSIAGNLVCGSFYNFRKTQI